MAPYRILCLDGGGIKGLFTATVLDRLQAQRPDLVANADLIAGTSTGGILALGLASGKTPAELAGLYRNEAKRIFDDSFWDDLIDLGNAVGSDYSNKGLKKILKREFGAKTLAELGKQVLIPTFDLDADATPERPRIWKPKFFHNFPGTDSDGDQPVVDVALATSAAPTYFPSHKGFIDGGVVANNPSMAAVVQALDPRGGGKNLNDLAVLSLGTGLEPKFIRGNVDWGWGQWARPMVSLMISGIMGVATFQCQQLLGEHYLRVDDVFDRGVDMDSTDDATLVYLQQRGSALDLDAAVTWLGNVGW